MKSLRSLILSFLITPLAQADGFLPRAAEPAHFEALQNKSPFTRTLNLPNSLLLTGFATIDGNTVALVADAENGQSFPVSNTPNQLGWKLVAFSGENDLESALVTIGLGGGETVRVVYDEAKHQSMTKVVAAKIKKSHPSPSKANVPEKAPVSDIRKRFESLSDEQKARAGEIIKKKYETTPNMTSEERTRMYNGVIDYVQSGKK